MSFYGNYIPGPLDGQVFPIGMGVLSGVQASEFQRGLPEIMG